MTENKQTEKTDGDNDLSCIDLSVRWGLLGVFGFLTVGGIWLASAVLWPQQQACWSDWTHMPTRLFQDLGFATNSKGCLAPNEVGDLLAGIFATLAFLWLLYTVVLQWQELSMQRKELKITNQIASKQEQQLAKQADSSFETARMGRERQGRRDLDTLIQFVRPMAQKIARHTSPHLRNMSDHEYMLVQSGNIARHVEQLSLDASTPVNDPALLLIAQDLKRIGLSLMLAAEDNLGTFDTALYKQYGFPDLVAALKKIPDGQED